MKYQMVKMTLLSPVHCPFSLPPGMEVWVQRHRICGGWQNSALLWSNMYTNVNKYIDMPGSVLYVAYFTEFSQY